MSSTIDEEPAAPPLGRFVRSGSWNGLQAGDRVRVAGQSRRGRRWRFKAHVTNTNSGASWVEVILIEKAHPFAAANGTAVEEPLVERVRAFAPDVVSRGRRLAWRDREERGTTG